MIISLTSLIQSLVLNYHNTEYMLYGKKWGDWGYKKNDLLSRNVQSLVGSQKNKQFINNVIRAT